MLIYEWPYTHHHSIAYVHTGSRCPPTTHHAYDRCTQPLPANFELIAPALEARGSRLTETLLSSSEVRRRMTRRGADDIVRYGLRRGGEDEGGTQQRLMDTKSWYDEVEGLVPPSVCDGTPTAPYARDPTNPYGPPSLWDPTLPHAPPPP